jgi:tetratricopeptide (TPR) repeat protein
MPDTNSDRALLALLALEAEDSPVAASAQELRLPPLEERVEMFVNAVYGPGTPVTAAMRAAAREQILTAMACDLADDTIGPAPRNATAPAPGLTAAEAAAPWSDGLSRFWAGLAGALQRWLAPAAEAFTVRGLRLAAVPLLALFVVGSVWTGSWMIDSDNRGAGNAPTPSAPISRSLMPSSVAEQNLERSIAADEAALGPTHPAVARKLVDLADLYRADRRYDQAAALCSRALAIQQRALGPKHPDTIRTLKELAAIYRAEGRTREADELLTQAGE